METNWRYESDGGRFWDGSRWRHSAPTHYVTNSETMERIDCMSAKEARELRDKLNGEDA